MTWIRIDDQRINAEEIVAYSKAIGGGEDSHSELSMSNGNSIFVRATLEEIDQMIGINTPKQVAFTHRELQAIFDFLEDENHHGSDHDCELCSVTNKLFENGFGKTSQK